MMRYRQGEAEKTNTMNSKQFHSKATNGQFVHLAKVFYSMESFTEQKIKDYQN